MFVVLYGLTGTIGDKVRQYMIDKNYKKLDKIYYTSSEDEKKRLLSDGMTLVSSPEEIYHQCDYHYIINNRLVGLNKKNFDTAVRGKDSLFTSLSSLDIEFLSSLKGSYTAYVTVIYVYMDNETLKTVINEKYSKDESEMRLETGIHIKEQYINNVNIFDNVVIYGGEASVFNAENLLSQIDRILIAARTNEIAMNSKRIVQFPYAGSEDYIFISYAHNDSQQVLDKLFLLQRNGYRIWYDSGIKGGEDWRKVLFDKIKNCKNFVLFVSENSVISDDVKIEIITAVIFEKKIIIVNLDDSKFENTIGNMLYNISSIDGKSEAFLEKMTDALDSSTMETKKRRKKATENKNNDKEAAEE